MGAQTRDGSEDTCSPKLQWGAEAQIDWYGAYADLQLSGELLIRNRYNR